MNPVNKQHKPMNTTLGRLKKERPYSGLSTTGIGWKEADGLAGGEYEEESQRRDGGNEEGSTLAARCVDIKVVMRAMLRAAA